jgi:hypothetical protein
VTPVADVHITHAYDLAAVRVLLTSPQRGVVQDLLGRGLRVETAAKRNLGGVGGPRRIDTGRLRASINTQLASRGGVPIVYVGTNVKYGILVHNGTGLYGPRHRMIRPRRAKFLRFRIHGRGRWIYARQVRGMRPNHFLTNALHAAGR